MPWDRLVRRWLPRWAWLDFLVFVGLWAVTQSATATDPLVITTPQVSPEMTQFATTPPPADQPALPVATPDISPVPSPTLVLPHDSTPTSPPDASALSSSWITLHHLESDGSKIRFFMVQQDQGETLSIPPQLIGLFDMPQSTWTFQNEWQSALRSAQNAFPRDQSNAKPHNQPTVRISLQLGDAHATVLENLEFVLPEPIKQTLSVNAVLVVGDSSLARMNKLQTLIFNNFQVDFTSPTWTSAGQQLRRLVFDHCVIDEFACQSLSSIDEVKITNSEMTHFPLALLQINNPRLVMQNVSIEQPIELNASELETLQSVDFTAENVSANEQFADCTNTTTLKGNLKVCVTGPASVSQPISPVKGQQDTNPKVEPQAQEPAKSHGGTTTVVIVLSVFGGLVLVVSGYVLVVHRSKDTEDRYIVASPTTDAVDLQTNLLSGSSGDRDKTPIMGDTGVLGELEIPEEEVVVGQKLGIHGLWRAEYLNIKVVMLKVLTDQSSKAAMQRFTCAAMSFVNLRHSNVMLFIGIVRFDRSEIGVLVEHMQKGSLRSLLANPQVDLSWKQRLRIAQDLCRGLTFVQSVKTARHFSPNLCAQRVFCDEEYNCKVNLFDYGMPLKEDSTPLLTYGIGIMPYRAPEVLLSGQTTEESQIYALGIIFCELSSQVQPYHEMLVERGWTVAEILIAQGVASGELKPEMTGDAPEVFRDLTARCLSFDPKDRPALSEISSLVAEL